jgi:phosphoribosylamine-glycine ligase
MPRTVTAVQTKGPYVIEVTVRTGDGEKQNTTTINGPMAMGATEDMISYSAMKSAIRAFRSICWGLVKREHPLLQESDKEFGLIWRATLQGRDINVPTSEEVDMAKAECERIMKESTTRRYHIWTAWLHVWVGLEGAGYELWRAIRG